MLGVSVEADALRPILSGVAGAAISAWLLQRLSRWVPLAKNGKSAEALVSENRARIYAANTFFFLGIIGALFVYQRGYFPRNDWRPAALGLGFGCVAPVLFLFLSTVSSGSQKVREAYVAYAISQKAPPLLLYSLMSLGFVAFCVGLASLADA